jgi:hypothetical protein
LVKLYLINKGQLNEINNPVFSTGDVYLVDDESAIYVWIGSKCSIDEKTSGAAFARKLDQERGGAAKIITIDQAQETPEFLKAITKLGAMKIVERNVAKTMLKDVVTGDWAQFAEHKNVLYQISSEEFENINTMKMIQVPFSKKSLASEDCFVADLGTKVYIWQGSACNVKEKVKAGQWARNIDADRPGLQNETIFDEGNDTEFLKAIERGENYKESDAVQLRAESELEAETDADKATAAIKSELKSEIKEAPKIKSEISSSAAPGVPGKVDESILSIEKGEGRRKCPKCGNDDKLMIHESIDKTNIVLDYPRVYGKKYRCGKCGTNWREK